jgi:pyruvate dehydrogenase E1 component alpha subunit
VSTVASFSIDYIQYLDEHGNLSDELPPLAHDKKSLLALYKTMTLIREFDNKGVALQRTGKMGTYAQIHGQEAISTAIGYALKKDDVLVPYYRDYAAQYLRGVKLSEIYQYWGGDERGSQFENNKEDLPICVPIATQCLHAAGIASAFKYRKQKRVALTCIGEGGTSEGEFYEALNVAGAWHLPVVFVINSNGWAISVPREKQTATKTIAQKAIAAGIKGIQVDGNDAIATREVIGRAIENARRGLGPTVVECLTYRLCDHTTADDASRYQPSKTVEIEKTKEPLARLRNYLVTKKYWSPQEEEVLLTNVHQEVNQAANEYLAKDTQPLSSMFDYHYETLPDELAEQRDELLREAN